MAEIVDFNVTDASNTARWPEGMAPAGINDAGRADEGILARWYKDTDGSITSGGSSNAYTATSNRTISSLVNNTVIAFTANHTNTGAATFALNGLTAKAIRRPNGDALVANDIVSGQQVVVVYKSSPDYWQMLSPGVFGATDSVVGGLAIATQALMEAAASLFTAVTPARQHYHPGHPKAAGRGAAAGGVVGTAYNVASITHDSTGNYTVTLTNALANTNYWVTAVVISTSGTFNRSINVAITSSSVFTVHIRDADSDATRDEDFGFAVYGDFA